MKNADVRQSFIDFFAERGHRPVPSSPLVPHGDATLLFTNAGMVQFKDFFTGAATPEFRRAVTVQKCLRVSGKHNDLENVGPSPRHHTFFEMLGNFSFGDYFKPDAIAFGWDLVTRVWGLDPAHLFASIFEQDDEAFELWRKISTLPAERIVRCGEKDNFWAMGDTGPCGPCSEIYVDRSPGLPKVSWEEGTDSGRYLEIWNLVFMQFERSADGSMRPLPNPSIDTGAGLERVTAVLEGVESNYDSDLFQPILRAAAALAATEYGRDAARDVSLRVIADHLRAVTFLLADGVIPSNDGRGYVLRRILRRAVRHGLRLGFEEPFLHRLLPVLREGMGAAYPELATAESSSQATVRAEEEKFLSTVANASRLVQEAIEETKSKGGTSLAGGVAFRFYDTHGLPFELIREIAEEERFGVDESGFQKAMSGQRERSREATGDSQKRMGALAAAVRDAGEVERTSFEGERAARDQASAGEEGEKLQVEGRVLHVLAEDDRGGFRIAPLLSAEPGELPRGVVIVDRTPFYAESGGQVGDRGEIRWPGGSAEVVDVQKSNSGVFYHFVRVLAGGLRPSDEVTLRVTEGPRRSTERNHTGTHLLHAALRQVLGEGVHQAGSLVGPDRLRFDFTFGRSLTAEEKARVEDLANEWIRRAVDVDIRWRGQKEAVAAGAMALFGEKYGERVRTVAVPGFSFELCGGCHVRNTGEIGLLAVVAERGIASGVRRIEALTGEGALAWVRQRERLLEEMSAAAGVPAERAAEEIRSLRERLREGERELSRLRLKQVAGGGDDASEQTIGGVRVISREVPPAPVDDLRKMADALRDRLGSGVVVLGARGEGKVNLVAAVSKDLTPRLSAGAIVKKVAPLVGGSGGGRPDFAQAGGKDPQNLPTALAAVGDAIREMTGG
jgi:alanyl-tRNA synthetase